MKEIAEEEDQRRRGTEQRRRVGEDEEGEDEEGENVEGEVRNVLRRRTKKACTRRTK